MKKNRSETYNRNFLDAFANALNGIKYCIKTQRNIKIQILITILVIISGAILQFTSIEFVLLFFACGLVLVAEMINTAIETSVNLVTKEYNLLAKLAKDVGAGGVLAASINAVIVGCILFLGKIF